MAHDHHHGELNNTSRTRIRIVFTITFLFMILEAIGGWWTGSLALLSDAGHMLTDSAALGLAMLAMYLSARPSSPERSFGWRRAEIMAAMINGVALFVIAALIVREGLERYNTPQNIKTTEMLAIAGAGLVVNLFAAYLLMGSDRDNLNIRGALFHVAGDALGSVGAITAAIMIMLAGWTKADAIASFILAAIIVVGALKLVGDSAHIFLESTPRHIDLIEVEKALLAHPAVASIHDLHVWTITSGFVSLSAHVGIECASGKEPSVSDTDNILRQLGETLHDKFDITHYTIQIEMEPCGAVCCETCSPNNGKTCDPAS